VHAEAKGYSFMQIHLSKQLSDFTDDEHVFARPQAIEDRKMMSAVGWWNLYGVTSPKPEDYEKSLKNWDKFAYEDDLDNGLETIYMREHATLYSNEIDSSGPPPSNASATSNAPSSFSTRGISIISQPRHREEIARGKRSRNQFF
ncbi:unnamed protein product, partial [Ilex paraguariensis]